MLQLYYIRIYIKGRDDNMVGSIKKLKDRLGNYIYPVVSSQGVYMLDGETLLDTQLDTQLDAQLDAMDAMDAKIEDDIIALDEKITLDLAEKVSKTLADITYYVATTGNDITGDGTSELPFKTIQFAIDKLPQIINHKIVIEIAEGTYAEDVTILGFIGKGLLNLRGGDSLEKAANHVCQTVAVYSCFLEIVISGLTANSSTQITFDVRISSFVIFQYCRSVSILSSIGIYFTSSTGRASTCKCSNKGKGIAITYCSTIFSSGCIGIDNAIGLYASNASTLGKSGDQPSGTIAESSSNGGVIR